MTEHFDVLIVGAGLSGIGAARHLQMRCPDRSFVLLEGRGALGGTWDLFRYPGVRSDSDMHTLGYSFKPWRDAKAIADGPSILAYVDEAAREHGIDRHIRFHHQVRTIEWSTPVSRWTITADRTDSGERVTFTAGFILMCAGYYNYRHGHAPRFPGQERFSGPIVHPQQWPEGLDFSGKQVVVIGSGATAITLVPAMTPEAAHVTMVQRSPTYVLALPDHDLLANRLRRVLPERWAYAVVRRKNMTLVDWFYGTTRRDPDKVRRRLLSMVRKQLPGFDVDTHFTPTYNPWDQRLCVVPNGDLFAAIRSGKVSVVTDRIDTFTEGGVRVASGAEIAADVIVTATGLELVSLGEIDLFVDGKHIDLASTWTYKGVAYSGVPNLIATFGYINASWTLRADMIAEFACRVLNHMRAVGARQATPRLREGDQHMVPRPWIDGFSAGYVQRMLPRLPKQGDREPWLNPQRLRPDRRMLIKAPVDDGVLAFT